MSTTKLNMPIVRPIQIKTKGLPKYKAIWTWLTSRRKWEVVEDYYFKFEDIIYKIPNGFIFDGASIPRLFWIIYSPTGILFIPSIFHDYGYKYGYYLIEGYFKWPGFHPYFSFKSEIDKTFCRMSEKINGFKIVDLIPYLMVRWFGRWAWNSHRKEEKIK